MGMGKWVVKMKEYQGEKAIISLTSWKARINTVGLTIYNLLNICPGFHIVLCLSTNEFPHKENELPADLNILADANKIEILWIHENVKVYKKVLYTMEKYKFVPVISADDDCYYSNNYADELYNTYLKYPKSIIPYFVGDKYGFKYPSGPWTLYPPYCFGSYGVKCLTKQILAMNSDDSYYGCLAKILNITFHECETHNTVYRMHDAICGISDRKRTKKEHEMLFLRQYFIISETLRINGNA